jgi:glycogen synthase
MSLYRALELFKDSSKLEAVRSIAVELDFSWDRAVQNYLQIYKV